MSDDRIKYRVRTREDYNKYQHLASPEQLRKGDLVYLGIKAFRVTEIEGHGIFLQNGFEMCQAPFAQLNFTTKQLEAMLNRENK